MSRFSYCAFVAGFVASLTFPVHFAHAVTIVIDGGLGQECYEMTYAVSKGDPTPPSMTMTGSQVPLGPIEVCTIALREGVLATHDLAATYNNRGVLYFVQSSFAEAAADFEDARRLDATIAEVHVNHGATMIALKKWAEGVASLDKGIALEPAEIEKAFYNRAIANEELGNVRGAYLDYRKAAELKPDWEQPRQQLTRFTVRIVEGPAK